MFDDPRWGDDPREREDRHDDGRHVGRGPSSREEQSESGSRDRDDERRPDLRERDLDPRDAFMQSLNLPRGLEREVVYDARERDYTLRGSETRTLSTVGAFRVVSARDLRDHRGREATPRDGDLRHLREQGLIKTVRLEGRRDVAVVLTERGRDLLDSHRDRGHEPRQEFYSGLKRERELEHDAQVYRAYLSVAERLAERDARIERVVLDYELKREYQQWLHERDQDGSGRAAEQKSGDRARSPGAGRRGATAARSGTRQDEHSGAPYVGELLHDRIIGALELCCRRGEMLLIQNRRVNWDTCQIGIPGATAKDRENRRIPFNPKGRLAAILKRRDTLGPDAFVFGSTHGTYQPTIQTAWQTLKLLANSIEPRTGKEGEEWNRQQVQRIDLRWHDLRHEGACRLLADGVDIRVIQLMLGHASIQQTQRYLNVTDEELRRGLEVSWINQGRPLRLASQG